MGRLLTLFTGFASVLLLPLMLPQAAVGTYFMVQILVVGLSTFVQCGLTYSIPSLVSASVAKNDLGRARRLLTVFLAFIATFGTIVSVSLWLLSLPLENYLTGLSPCITQTAVQLVAATVTLTACSFLLAEALRAIHVVRVAAMLNAIPGTLLVAGLLTFYAIDRSALTLELVFMTAAAGHLVAIVIGIYYVLRVTSAWTSPPQEPISASKIVQNALPSLATTMVLFGLSQLDMLLMASFGTLDEVANYGVALRLATLLVMPLSIANSAFAPILVHRWSIKDLSGMRDILKRVVIVCVVLALLAYLMLALLGKLVVDVWNPAYALAYPLALILGAGYIGHVLGGSSGTLLMVLGDQRVTFAITVAWGLVTLALSLVAVLNAGPLALAATSAACNAAQVLFFSMRLHMKMGIHASIVAAAR